MKIVVRGRGHVSASPLRLRLGAVALAIAGVLFVAYPAVRPWKDESTVAGAVAAMSTSAWVASHLFAMIGFILIPLGLLAVRAVVSQTRAERLAFVAFVMSWIGAGLILPFYGAEDFGLHAVATWGQGLNLLAIIDETRYGVVAATTFGLGLGLLGVGAVLAAVAIGRSGVLPRYSGVLFALGFALFIPQFFAPAAVRIAHGVLVGVGSVWLAVALWRAADR